MSITEQEEVSKGMSIERLEELLRISGSTDFWRMPCVNHFNMLNEALEEVVRQGRRVETLEMALDGLLEVVEVVEHNGFIWHEWFEKKVAEARAVQAGGLGR